MYSKRVIIIPARYGSTRFPGKPLVALNGKAAILHTIDAAGKVGGVDGVYVATDDERISAVVEKYGYTALLTSTSCRNGTERVAEAASILGLNDDDLVVNLQGDAPLTPPEFAVTIFAFLAEHPEADVVTPVIKCSAESYLRMADDVREHRIGATTSVFDARNRALYFSKSLLPHGSSADTLTRLPVYHHVGLYGYRVRCLKGFHELPVGPLECAEKLEQLRFLENGHAMYVVEVENDGQEFWELNHPVDVAHLERALPKGKSAQWSRS
ncbi:3-deoxy-manno-octulosonate cytidylyltransferase [Mesorhizobium carmichaelinearum]|uniref:3-deoxy-manno-octulosonate cytidylyltransferase n=1 Tax=Mesorhizobium carmichaelinearum TaxID=1208188 RepID=UPI000BA3AA32|nr:3-deoxy-manno-octulosonate cytidylyltransferase [Mesorhizobium carmichaelinearum]